MGYPDRVKMDRSDLRQALFRLAQRQVGYFTAAQARDLISGGVGYSYQAQKFHVDRGNWLRVDRGLFRLPDWPVGPHDAFVRWSLWSRGRGVVSHESALVAHDLGVSNPSRVHLTVPRGFRQRDEGVALHAGPLDDADVLMFEGFRVTAVRRTLIDLAIAGIPHDELEAALGEALERGVLTARTMRAAARSAGAEVARRIELALEEYAS